MPIKKNDFEFKLEHESSFSPPGANQPVYKHNNSQKSCATRATSQWCSTARYCPRKTK